MYKAMKAFGHNCYIVASVNDQSGMGGRAVFTTSANLTTDTEFGIVKAGAPSIGTDPNDSHIWYYNGTPATQVFVALDYVLPRVANFTVPDLVLSGPNFGLNLGPFLYTISGTIGATYAAIERGLPAIAFSAGNTIQTPYYWANVSTAAGLLDPATITGRLCANLAQALITKAAGGRILPLGYGLSVNIPFITSFTNTSCVNPPFVLTRQTGGAVVDKAVYNTTSGLFTFQNIVPEGANQCINGDCSLPGETQVLTQCRSSVSVFTVDYDAPTTGGACGNGTDAKALVPSIVQANNATVLVGGLGANASVVGAGANGTATMSATVTASATSTPTTVPINAGKRAVAPVTAIVLGLMIAIFM
jgi:5'-nucleotidase